MPPRPGRSSLTRSRWPSNGVFALILECLPDRLGRIITQSLDIPTIGIGSGADCDGQALVTQDMLGLYKELSPRFLKIYADLAKITVDALGAFRREVETGAFPHRNTRIRSMMVS